MSQPEVNGVPILDVKRMLRRLGTGALVVVAACFAQEVRLIGPGTPGGGSGPGGGTGDSTLHLTLAPPFGTLAVNVILQLVPTLVNSQGVPVTPVSISWSSSNASVVSVDQTGRIRAMAIGGATITASTLGVAATAAFTVVSTPVATVSLAPTTATIQLGATLQFTATARDVAGNILTGRAITWSTTNAAALTIDASGTGRAVGTGSAVVTAISEGQSGSSTVTVQNVPVSTVVVAPATATIQIGQQTQLTATPRDSVGNALSGRVVTWSSSAPAIARASGNGLIDGLTPGTATITATSESKTGSATITVIPVPVASVVVAPQSVTVQVGATTTFAGTPRDANGNALVGRVVTWSSANTNVAQVSPTGVVSGVAPGSVLISATCEGVVGSAFVTVTTAPATLVSVVINPQTAALLSGQTQAYTLTGTLSDASTVPVTGTYTATGGTVNGSGIYTAPDISGTFLVIGTASGTSLRDTATVTVTRPPVATVQVSPASGTVNVGQTLGLTATVRDASGNVLTNRVVAWASNNTPVATVSGGVVTGQAVGSASITATSEGQSGSAAITIQLTPVATVQVAPTTATLDLGLTLQLTATVRDANGNVLTGRVVTWSTSAPAVASVSGTGLVTALTVGTSTITATCEGRSAQATITTILTPVASVTVTPPSASLIVASSVQLTATPRSASGTPLTGRIVTWSSSNDPVASVTASGLVTGQALGAATITATSEGRNGTASIAVLPPSAGEPVYSAANTDHLLHVYEDWSGITNISQLTSTPRPDGGGPWINEGIQSYGSVVNVGDGFGSVRHLTTDYASDPPIPPHGTGAHAAGFHWYLGTGDDNAVGGGKNNRGLILGVGTYRNKPAKASVVYEWAIRYRGTAWYEGKTVDINAGYGGGVGRFNFEPFDSPLGWTGTCADPVCLNQYAGGGYTPLYAGLPPTFSYTAPNITRTQTLGLMPNVTIWYKQNAGWGTSPGTFSWGASGTMGGAFNADTRGTNTPLWQAGWLYYKLQLTKQAPGQGPGNGRIEMWIGPTPGALIKVMDYQGDVGRREAGLVFIDPTGTNDQLVSDVHFFGLASRRYQGGGFVDIGSVRIWSHSRAP